MFWNCAKKCKSFAPSFTGGNDGVARIEGLLEAVFMRRDLTPAPEPPPPGKPEAA